MHRPSNITATPYKSSYLAIPPLAFSPQFPITPPASPPPSRACLTARRSSIAYDVNVYGPPPQQPMRWMWQCHHCRRVYPLGATRRCLDDGHHFCAGTVTWKKGAKGEQARKVVKSCPSEFDYHGWKAWGSWRRRIRLEMESDAQECQYDDCLTWPLSSFERRDSAHSIPEDSPAMAWRPVTIGSTKDCWNCCDYPSNCRWGTKYGVESPWQTPKTVVSGRRYASSAAEREVKALRNEVLHVATPKDDDCAMHAAIDSSGAVDNSYLDTIEDLLATETQQPSLEAVVETAMRRKRRSTGHASSPLAFNDPPSTILTALAEETASLNPQIVTSSTTLFQDFARLGSHLISSIRSTSNQRNENSSDSQDGEAMLELRR